MLKKFLDPKTDIAFKRIFGSEKNKDILIDFLNDVLEKTGNDWIVDLEYLPTIQDPEIAMSKVSVVDIICRDRAGVKYIIEVQVAKTQGFEKRAQYYAAKAYCNQMMEGGKYRDLKEVIFLAILDYEMFPKNPDYKSDHVTLNRKTFEHDLKDFSFTFIELPKFKTHFQVTDLKKCQTDLEKWCYFLAYANKSEEADVQQFHDELISKAYSELNKNAWTQLELDTYEAAQKQIMDARAIFDNAVEEGVEKGLKAGMEKWTEKGKIEGQTEMMRTMHNNGMSVQAISKAIGMPEEETRKRLDV